MGQSTTSTTLPVTFLGRMKLFTCFFTSCRCVSSAPVDSSCPYMTQKLFLASLLSAIIYSLIFLVLRGTLAINGGLKIHIDPERRLRISNGTFEEYQRYVYSVARTMLW